MSGSEQIYFHPGRPDPNIRPNLPAPENLSDAIERAEGTETTFPAKERSIYIRDHVRKIETLKTAGKTKEEIWAQVEEFANNYPSLFNMVMSPDYDKANLRTMLAMMERMGDEDGTRMSQHQASIEVGKQLASKYVRPALQGRGGGRH